MIKRILSLLLVLVLALSLCACDSIKDIFNPSTSDDPPELSGLEKPDADAPAHEHLYYKSEQMMVYARHSENLGAELQSYYYYGMALAPISSLRFCIDNILWLKGEGEVVADIVGNAPYGNWDDIVYTGIGSPMPFFFEGLLFTFQGKSDEAAECYKKAKANPTYEEMDFNYLKSMSIEDLYALKKECGEKESKILNEYSPKTMMYAERTGAEFSPIYHAALAADMLEAEDNYAVMCCFLNAVISNPQIPDYYASAALMAMQNNKTNMATTIVNDGLIAFPKNGEINYVAATIALADGDTVSAKSYLETAKKDSDLSDAYVAQCDLLLGQIGG